MVDEVVLVDTDEICAAIQDTFEDTRAVAEPSGALAIAGSRNSSRAKARASASSRSTAART